MVSNAHGALRRVLLFFPREAVVRRGYRAVYADLLNKLPTATRLTVLVHPAVADVLTELLERSDRRATTTVVFSDEDLLFSVWAQDPCVILRSGHAGWAFLTPARFDRQQDARAVEVIAEATDAEVVRSVLNFHGGDVLTGDNFVLVGRDCIDATLEAFAKEPAVAAGADPRTVVLEHFQDLLSPDQRVLFVGTERPFPQDRTRTIHLEGREVVEVLPGSGGSPHPLVHLDMFLALAGRGPSGRYRVLVGSPASADELLGRAAVDPELSAHLDDVASELADDGFEVLRNPLPLTHADGRRELAGEMRDVRLWYLATANNVLVQIDREGGDHVWLPTYGHGAWKELSATDAANRRLWKQLGFTVHELTSFHTFAQRFGALHCIAKELDRSPLN